MSALDPDRTSHTLRMVWIALLASQLIYAGIALSGAARVRTEPLDAPIFPVALGIVAFVTAMGAHFAWRRGADAGRTLHAAGPQPDRAFTYRMLSWVLDESIAVYGLVLSLLAFSTPTWSAFSVAAFALMLIHRPPR